jgi:predicted SAM-dependent methyltransferase
MPSKPPTRRFDLIAAILVSLTVGFSAGKVYVREGGWVDRLLSLKASISRKQIISDYIRNHAVRKLQIGAGGQGIAGWLNTDIEPQGGEAYLDATKLFPIPNGGLTYIFSEHVFEHLSYNDVLVMLRECHRTLQPGGKVRIATPNLLTLIRLFQDSKTDEMRNYISGKLKAPYWPETLPLTVSPECVILNYELKSFGHQFVYDPQTLRESLERTGFQAIKEFAPGESDDPQLAGVEARQKWSDHAINDYETMVFQAVRQ